MTSWSPARWWFVVVLGFALGCATGYAAGFLAYKLPPSPWLGEFTLLVIAGGLGGLAQALLLGTNQLQFPGPATGRDGRAVWDAGFLADVFVGMVGAVASLMFALALLNDKLFGAVGGTPADGAVLVPPWARVVAFGVLAGFAARQLLPNLSERMKALIATEVDAKGRELNEENRTRAADNANRAEIAAALAEVARMTAADATPRPAVAAAAAAGVAAGATGATGAAAVRPLLDRFTDIPGVPPGDKRALVAAKKEAAETIQHVVAQQNLTTEVMAREAAAAGAPKEWVLALATMTAVRPGAGDAGRLFNAYDRLLATPDVRAESKFILYRVLLAVVALHNARLLPPAEVDRARKVADDCLAVADDDLRRLAAAVRALLG